MWNQKLINEGYDTVFFNAWENDFVEDAFIAFVEEIREKISGVYGISVSPRFSKYEKGYLNIFFSVSDVCIRIKI